jgi:chemotaxis protein CheX
VTVQLDSINAFVQATGSVLMTELGTEVRRGPVTLQKNAEPTNEVTTLLSFTGALTGTVIYSMSLATAIQIVSRMMDQAFPELDELGQSGIAELGNVITGNAMTLLAQAGYACEIAPPVVAVSKAGSIFSTLDLPRLSIPLYTDLGTIDLHLAFKARR